MSLDLYPPGSLDTLLSTHDADIKALKSSLGDALPKEDLYDSIWLLRYCLSFKEREPREKAARDCIAWRKENSQMLQDVAEGVLPAISERIAPYMVAGFHGFGKGGEPLFVVRASVCDPKAIMDTLTEADLLPWFMAQREQAFIMCDKATRVQRRLVKQMSVIAMSNSSLSGFDKRYFAVIAKSGKMSEYCYPQLLLKSCSFDPPTFFMGMFTLFKPLMSRTMLEKFALCPGLARGGSAAACPFASKLFDMGCVLGLLWWNTHLYPPSIP